jgi:hypothetical protein
MTSYRLEGKPTSVRDEGSGPLPRQNVFSLEEIQDFIVEPTSRRWSPGWSASQARAPESDDNDFSCLPRRKSLGARARLPSNG